MIWEIAMGIVFGFLLLAAILVFLGCLFIVISKAITIHNTTIKRYDFEEEDEDDDWRK